ncbi:MAG: serine/threonine protein kinase [Thermomicrobiales bacterium]
MASLADERMQRTVQLDDEGPRRVVAGHYSVDLSAPLGQGGMALVYRGRDLRTRREVALKTLRLEYRDDPDTRARFRLEARTMAFLKHPNVARVYDLYEDAEAPWAVLEYVPGDSLKDLVQQHGPFELSEVANTLDQVASALAHLHAKGLVHLDVKPQNVLMTAGGVVKLIDFGLAQRAGQPQELIGGSAFGTVAYLAPEQATGEAVDVATDVYSLGCVVYELLTGRPPFEPPGDGEVKNEIIRAHLEQEPAPPSTVNPDLPVWVDSVVLWALAKSPEDRYRDVVSFADVFHTGVVRMADLADDSVALTAPFIIETHRIPYGDEAARSSLSRRAAHGLYRTGGKAARGSSGLRRLMWRATVAFALLNLLLALAIMMRDGDLPGLGGGEELGAGDRARVITDGLRIRASPGVFSPQIGLASAGDELDVTGEPEMFDGEPWWPITYEYDGEAVDGYVWGGGLEARRDGVLDAVRDAVDDVTALPERAEERVRGWLP